MSAPYQAVKAADGYFVFGAANQKLWTAALRHHRPATTCSPIRAS